MVYVLVLNLYLAKDVVPCLAAFSLDAVEASVFQLTEVAQSLLLADERRCHLNVHRLTTLGLETDNCASMVACGLGVALTNGAVGNGSLVGERLVKLYNKKVLEIAGHATAVLGGVAHNHLLLRQNLDIGSLVEGINHDERLVALGIGETHGTGTLGGSKLSHDVVVGKIDAIIIRCGYLCLVREP